MPSRGRRHIFLSPGGLFCGDASFVVKTVLGSCIAVCLWDGHLRHGGINHFVLPRWNGSGPPLHYGDTSIDQMLAQLTGMGSRPAGLTAKLFGGAAVLGTGKAGETVGELNTAVARERLAAHRIPLAAQNVGGPFGRQIIFDLSSGEVKLRQLT